MEGLAVLDVALFGEGEALVALEVEEEIEEDEGGFAHVKRLSLVRSAAGSRGKPLTLGWVRRSYESHVWFFWSR